MKFKSLAIDFKINLVKNQICILNFHLENGT